MTFSIKQLQAAVAINPTSTTPTFSGSNSNTVSFGGPGNQAVKMRAEVHNAGGVDSTLTLSVWGLPLSVMNQLSTFGMRINLQPKNAITVLAGDDTGLSQIYTGSVLQSLLDPRQPEFGIQMTANAAAAFAAVAGKTASYTGATDVATAMQQIANQMGLKFENNGVNIKLADSYFYGSPRDQYNTVREHADIGATISNGVLAIWPKFQNRSGQPVILQPSDGTLIDYPTFTATGVQLRALFNPSFEIGKQVTVQNSQIVQANGTWTIYSLDHVLESQTPGGKWESVLQTSSPKFPTPIT